MTQSESETRIFKMQKKFYHGIEIQIPATDPVLQSLLKRILAEQLRGKAIIKGFEGRLRNLERITDGTNKIGVGTFRMLPVPTNVEQDDSVELD